jgi:hypothetical protein
VDGAALEGAASLARRWEAEATSPLRAVRRALKPTWPGIADDRREALRARVKDDELEAERCLLAALEAQSPASAPAGSDLIERLRAASAAWGAPVPKDLLARLAAMVKAAGF